MKYTYTFEVTHKSGLVSSVRWQGDAFGSTWLAVIASIEREFGKNVIRSAKVQCARFGFNNFVPVNQAAKCERLANLPKKVGFRLFVTEAAQ